MFWHVLLSPQETRNNNGYIPYVDYSREYLPTAAASPHHHLAHNAHLLQEVVAGHGHDGQPHAAIVVATNRDSYVDPAYGSLSPRYVTRSSYADPYLRSTQPPVVLSAAQHSPLGSVYGTVTQPMMISQPRYITTPASQQVKPGTLATHV